MPKRQKPTSPAQFAVGDQVHVRSGVTDPDFADMPLGGWAGAVKEIEAGSPITYLVRWNRHTLQSIHPVFKNRCEIEGFDCEEMWLGENDLEPDTAKPLPIEQPTKITTKPLSMKDQDDRLRAIFGLTSNERKVQLPLAEIDVAKTNSNHQLLDDYSYWFWNWR